MSNSHHGRELPEIGAHLIFNCYVVVVLQG